MKLVDIVEKLSVLGRDPGPDKTENPAAAVAAILRENDGAAEIFFIQRAQRTNDPWSGHVAFPGGRREPADPSLLGTAIRETEEEVGILLTESELVARLPDLPAFTRTKKGGSMVVSPYVFVVDRPLSLTANPDEVATTMWIPFECLFRGEGRGTFDFTWENRAMELPCFHLGTSTGASRFDASAIAAGQPILWGMTYRMLETLFEALLPVHEQI